MFLIYLSTHTHVGPVLDWTVLDKIEYKCTVWVLGCFHTSKTHIWPLLLCQNKYFFCKIWQGWLSYIIKVETMVCCSSIYKLFQFKFMWNWSKLSPFLIYTCSLLFLINKINKQTILQIIEWLHFEWIILVLFSWEN